MRLIFANKRFMCVVSDMFTYCGTDMDIEAVGFY